MDILCMEEIKNMIKEIIIGELICLSGVLVYYLVGNILIFDIMLAIGATIIYTTIFFYVTSAGTGLSMVRK